MQGHKNLQLSFFQKICLLISLAVGLSVLMLIIYFQTGHPFQALISTSAYVKEAKYWQTKDLGVQCTLCPQNCYLTEGAKGKCQVRMNRANRLYTQVYAQPVSMNIDPIEKKPVFHMMPGSQILSLSTVGCPLTCTFCQNWSISQTYPEEVKDTRLISPQEIVAYALEHHIPSIAYTYGEPVAFFEYMLETAKLAKKHGLKNVMVTSGYFNPKPLLELLPYFDVIKVDLKGMCQEFYRDEIGGELLHVLNALKIIKQQGVMLEVVNLVVPNRNDKTRQFIKLAKWVAAKLGPDTPVFFSRFHPDYKLSHLPPTPITTLETARKIALDQGLHFVYLGNVPGHVGENTYCPYDGTLLIERKGYHVIQNHLKDGRCPICGRKVPGVW